MDKTLQLRAPKKRVFALAIFRKISMCCNDRHRYRCRVSVKLTQEQIIILQQFLPLQKGVAGKIHYLLEQSVEIEKSESGTVTLSITPPDESAKSYSVRVADDLYDFVKSAGLKNGLDITMQATVLVLYRLEQLKAKGQPPPEAKKELRSSNRPKKLNRLNCFRQGFRLIWKGIIGH